MPARVGRQVTQEEVAESLEVSRTWYAMLESGAGHVSIRLANRIVTVFSLTPRARAELFRLALPDLDAGLSARDSPAERAPFALASLHAVTLIVGSQTEIDETAQRLAHARESFLVAPDGAVHGARQRILTSWQRSLAWTVDVSRRVAPRAVNSSAQLDELRGSSERLLRAADPVVRFLADHLAGSGYVIVITDGAGCILEMHGDADVRRRLERIEFAPGADWSEEAAGTNAVGTALADGRPLQMMAAEHFCDGWQHLTCTAAPIHDPDTFVVVGALDITGPYRLIRPDLLSLIMQCALEIEERIALLTGSERGVATMST